MGLFGKKGSPEKDLAKALALRGAQGRGEDPRKLFVEGHVRYRTDVGGGDIVVIEVEDVR